MLCGAGYRERSEARVTKRNGYRDRVWDTRAGSVELAIPKLRTGSYFPDWLLERQRRAEAALMSVVATCYLLGVSTQRYFPKPGCPNAWPSPTATAFAPASPSPKTPAPP